MDEEEKVITVGELIRMLEDFPQDAVVVIDVGVFLSSGVDGYRKSFEVYQDKKAGEVYIEPA